jgi:S-adenosylmethionine hydrolase
MKRPIVTLLTDFGLADHYVAAMKGVILGICPQAELVDISHEVTAYSIPEAAYTLMQAWRCFPKGTIHLAVVDPGVGSSRKAIVAEVAGHRFVAPDNGLLSLIQEFEPGIRIREITASRYFRKPASNTFHGRDVFAPIAAHLASGLAASKLGKLITNPVRGDFTKPTQIGPSIWMGAVLKVDRFGNVVTNFDWQTFQCISAGGFELRFGSQAVTHFHPTYSDAPARQLFATMGSAGYIEVSLNQQDAARSLGIVAGGEIRLNFAESGPNARDGST